MFDRFVAAADRADSDAPAPTRPPWHIVEGEDEHYRTIVVGAELRDAIRRGLDRAHEGRKPLRATTKTREGRPASAIERVARQFNVLDSLDLTRQLSDKRFKTRLAEQQSRLSLLQRLARKQGLSTVVVFEGWDASGKGRAIRRVTAALDAREYDGHSRRRAVRGGARASLHVALLASPVPRRAPHRLRSKLGGGCSSSGRGVRERSRACAPTVRSTTSKSSSWPTASSSSSSDPRQQG